MTKEELDFTQPPKMCPKCGAKIPCNEFVVDEEGQLVLDSHKHPIRHKNAQLICEHCTRLAMAPVKRFRRMRGDKIEEQGTFEVPTIRIT